MLFRNSLSRAVMLRYPRLASLTIAASFVVSAAASAQQPHPKQIEFIAGAMRVQPKRWDKQHNFALLTKYAEAAVAANASLLVTCEGFLDGYTGNASHAPEMTREKYFDIGEPINGPWMHRIADLAAEKKLFLSVGFSERRGDQMFNSVAVFSPTGKLVLHYSKTHTKGEAFNTPGSHFPVARIDIGMLGALICADRLYPEVSRILALKGAQLLLLPAYGSDGELNEALLRTRAWENSAWIVYAKQDQALIINASGMIVARDRGKGDELVLARVELREKMGDGDILHRRDPAIYREILELQRK